MSCEIKWFADHRIIMCTVIGDITIEEVKQANEDIKVLLDQGRSPVHVISNVLELGNFPLNLTQIKNSTDYLYHPAMGWQVVAGHHNPMIRFIASVASQVAHVNLRMVDTMDEAITFLERVDQERVAHSS